MAADVKAHDRRWNLLHWLGVREAEIRSTVVVLQAPGVRLRLQSASSAAAASAGVVQSPFGWLAGRMRSTKAVLGAEVVPATSVDVAPLPSVGGHHVRRVADGLEKLVSSGQRYPGTALGHVGRIASWEMYVFLDECEVGGETSQNDELRHGPKTSPSRDGPPACDALLPTLIGVRIQDCLHFELPTPISGALA